MLLPDIIMGLLFWGIYCKPPNPQGGMSYIKSRKTKTRNPQLYNAKLFFLRL
jgi:hypothetical protein